MTDGRQNSYINIVHCCADARQKCVTQNTDVVVQPTVIIQVTDRVQNSSLKDTRLVQSAGTFRRHLKLKQTFYHDIVRRPCYAPALA